ncbi:hypothetical protein [Micromonospora sp. NPDC004551]|uniref:hypothetical protein n=1 Tax=Micromonospora sp. NPDC004551 TaxID=3154284 RepID=UPI0033AD8812
MRSRLLPALALAVALLAPIAGCGADDPPAAADAPVAAAPAQPEPESTEATEAPPSAAPPDACALVSRADAQRLAGTPVNAAVPVRESCTYTAPVTGPTAQVEVYVGDGAKKYLDIERELGHEVLPLAGVGDEAHLTAEAFFIRKGDVWVAVRLMRLNDPQENREPLRALARTVAGRM